MRSRRSLGRRVQWTGALLLGGWLGGCAAEPPPPLALRPTPGPLSFDLQGAMGHLRAVASLGVRRAGTPAEAAAAALVAEQLAASGFVVERQEVPLPWGPTSVNVVACPPGRQGSQLLVTAHLDSLGGPGANDNASGVGLLLELARVLALRPPRVTVKLVAFGAEERGPPGLEEALFGSRVFVASLSRETREEILGVINLDALGRGEKLLQVGPLPGPGEGPVSLLKLGWELGVPASYGVALHISDHRSFLEAGIPATWIYGGPDPAVHTAGDTVDRIDPELLAHAGRWILAALHAWPGPAASATPTSDPS